MGWQIGWFWTFSVLIPTISVCWLANYMFLAQRENFVSFISFESHKINENIQHKRQYVLIALIYRQHSLVHENNSGLICPGVLDRKSDERQTGRQMNNWVRKMPFINVKIWQTCVNTVKLPVQCSFVLCLKTRYNEVALTIFLFVAKRKK